MMSLVHSRTRSRIFPALALTLAGQLFACGGGELPRPRPVTSKLDEVYIARIPPDQRPEVTTTQNEFQLARSNKMNADEELKNAETEVRLAQAEVEKAQIEERSAQLKKKDAEASRDMTRVNAASAEVRAAELGRRAADARVQYARARRDYLKMVARYHEFEVINKEARFELEKAKVARSNNIRPTDGFAYEQFEAQQRDRSEAAQRAKSDAEKLRNRMAERERTWKAAEKDWNSARGVKAPPPPASDLKPQPDGTTPAAPPPSTP